LVDIKERLKEDRLQEVTLDELEKIEDSKPGGSSLQLTMKAWKTRKRHENLELLVELLVIIMLWCI
jgi:hypothetical protein